MGGGGRIRRFTQGVLYCEEAFLVADPRLHPFGGTTGKTPPNCLLGAPLNLGLKLFGHPHSTPLIAEGTVFAVGVDGQFHALDLRTGSLRWSKDLVASFKLTEYNAFASSPLAYGGNVVLPLGGSGRGIVAFRRDTGALAWQSDPLPLAPGAPTVVDVDGHSEMILWGQQEVAAFNPDDGRLLWRHPHPTQLGLNISTPVWEPGNRLFVSSAYGGGRRVLRLSRIAGRTTAKEVWVTKRLQLHFGAALRMGDLMM